MPKLRISGARCHCGYTMEAADIHNCLTVKKAATSRGGLFRAILECAACRFRWTVPSRQQRNRRSLSELDGRSRC